MKNHQRVLIILTVIPLNCLGAAIGLAQQKTVCFDNLPCSDRSAKVSFPNTRLELTQNATLQYQDLTIEEGTVIKTNGRDLSIKLAGELIIKGQLTIMSFDEEDMPGPPPASSGGRPGFSYNPGPNTEGPCRSCQGNNGGDGEQGQPGVLGNKGYDAGLIQLEVGGKSSGTLTIRNVGGAGGRGGQGGDGGNGGDGEQGGRARSGIVDCRSGPGVGGNGGKGGDGGSGGQGGVGGNGGIIVLRLANSADLALDTDVKEGAPGLGGLPGKGGAGGRPGFGGRGDGLCQGKEADRMGRSGEIGGPRTDADRARLAGGPGITGAPGRLVH